MQTDRLFEPITIKGKRFRNRIVVPPMVVNRGFTSADASAWYGARAAGGAAMVIVEATDIVLFENELNAKNLAPLVEAIHRGGALAAIQLFPGVRQQRLSPTDLSADQIGSILALYRKAADICAEAGFDGMEPHGAHGYVLNQFFSPIQNRRSDRYGGSFENRTRFALEILRQIQPTAHRRNMLLLYRHTPVGKGYGIEESLAFAEALLREGVDILDISPASHESPADRAAPFMRLGAPVIAVNEMDEIPRALEALSENRATLIAVGRAFIADADWARKVQENRLDEIITCIRCNQCYEDLDRGDYVGCSQW